MLEEDVIYTQNLYTQKFNEFGVSLKTLGWDKGKQDIRFDILTSQYACDDKSILDIGCGFGDLIGTLKRKASNFSYTGIDIMDVFIAEAQKMHTEYAFIAGDFMDYKFDEIFDYCIASGIFTLKLKQDNYEFISSAMQKAWNICRDGFAFDFLSDKVDYQLDHTFHSSPSKILDFAYSFSRNVILRNDYMPFEFSLFVFKDDSFMREDTLFTRYKSINMGKNHRV